MDIKKYLLLGMVLTLCFAPLALNVSAQEQESTATLDETLSWLKKFLAAEGTFSALSKKYPGDDSDYALTDIISVDRCAIGFSQSSGWTVKGQHTNGQVIKITRLPFADLDPLGTKVEAEDGYFSLLLNTTSEEPKIMTGPPPGGHSLRVAIRDRESADRILRAVKHAIKLCGGKVDPF